MRVRAAWTCLRVDWKSLSVYLWRSAVLALPFARLYFRTLQDDNMHLFAWRGAWCLPV